jgi:hypothetical protein
VILGTGCLGALALDGGTVRSALRTTGLDAALLVIRRDASAAGLAGTPAAAVRVPWDAVATGVEVAREVRAPRLVLELPPLLGLERACRELHDLARRLPGLALAVLTPAAGALADAERLALLCDDLASVRLGYWHRPAAVARLGRPETAWLDVLARHLVGMSLDDVADGEGGLPPGLGTLDLTPTAEACARTLVVALDVEPVPDVALLRMAVDQLRRLGFA